MSSIIYLYKVKCEAGEERTPWKVYVNLYGTGDRYSGNGKARIEFEKRLIEHRCKVPSSDPLLPRHLGGI
jgi:hypothetical protein